MRAGEMPCLIPKLRYPIQIMWTFYKMKFGWNNNVALLDKKYKPFLFSIITEIIIGHHVDFQYCNCFNDTNSTYHSTN